MRTIVTWILCGLLTVAFLGAATMKFIGSPMEIGLFTLFGYPLWFMYVIATLELVCAIGVLIPRYAAFAAALLACDMVGAIFSHLTHGQAGMAIAPFVLLLISIAVVILRGGVEQLRKLSPA